MADDNRTRANAVGDCTLTFEAFGAITVVQFEDEATRPAAIRQLPPGSRLIQDGAGGQKLHVGRDEVDKLGRKLRHHVAAHSPEVFVHAGAVSIAGAAVLIPGRSHTGKSTLVAALLEAGADYLSDEYAVIDPIGLVHPFPKPISIRADDGIREIEPEQLDARALDAPVPAAMILVTKFVYGARWDPQPIESGQAALALLDNTVTVRHEPRRALERISRLCAGVPGLKGERGEASEVAADVISRIRGGTSRP